MQKDPAAEKSTTFSFQYKTVQSEAFELARKAAASKATVVSPVNDIDDDPRRKLTKKI